MKKLSNYQLVLNNTNDLKETLIPNKSVIITILSILIFGYIIGLINGSLTNHPNAIEKVLYSETTLVQQYNEPFSESALKTLVNRLHIQHSDIVLKQSRIETGNYKSKVFLENNNLFGMKLAMQRITTATGINLNHATYKTWQESVIDYAIYQSTYLHNKSRNEYLAYLSANYAENPQYINLIKQLQ